MNKRWKLALGFAAPLWIFALACPFISDENGLAMAAFVFLAGAVLALVIGFSKAHTRDD